MLDLNLRDFDTAYHAFVARAPECVETITTWYIRAHRRHPNIHDVHHAYWRVLVERERWGTLRNALQDTWPGGAPVGGIGHGGTTDPSPRPDPAPSTPVPPTGAPSRVIRVTHDLDGEIRPRMMSDRANAFVRDGVAFVFCGTAAGPRLFKVDLASEHVERRGPIGTYGGETEGWYWTPYGSIVLPYGRKLISINPIDSGEPHVLLDISATHPGCDLWQPHSSDDGRTHSATVRKIVDTRKYPYVGTVVVKDGRQMFFPAEGVLDESQVCRDGSFVVIKELLEDNRIINLATGEVWDLSDADGAIGHSDCGPDFIVGEANLPGAGRCVKLDLGTRHRTTLFMTDNMGYVSVRNGICLRSSDTHLSLVFLDGSGMTPLVAFEHQAVPGSPNYYDQRPKANIDPSGRVACYMDGGVVKLLVL